MTAIASRPISIAVPESARILPGAGFADAYELRISGQSLDAVAAARRAMTRSPAWIGWLMRARNIVMAPFGVRTGSYAGPADRSDLGAFPVVSSSADRVVLGFDDLHLDFRVCIDVVALDGDRQSVTASTVVRTHNRLGRIYLAVVKPFHRVIVPVMLAQAARP